MLLGAVLENAGLVCVAHIDFYFYIASNAKHGETTVVVHMS